MNFCQINKNEFALHIEKGEEIMSSLTKFSEEQKITFASVQGIGAVNNVEIGVFHTLKKAYDKKTFSEDFELISALGNISLLENKSPYAHIHVALGKEDYSMIGGHLFSATVAVTTEFFIQSYDTHVVRKMNKDIGLKLWNLNYCSI